MYLKLLKNSFQINLFATHQHNGLYEFSTECKFFTIKPLNGVKSGYWSLSAELRDDGVSKVISRNRFQFLV